jgi:hypothetical protein
MQHRCRLVALFATLLPACTSSGLPTGGLATEAGAPPEPPPPDGGPATGLELPPLPDRETVPGPAPFHRLDALAYRNTVRDLVGDVPELTSDFLGSDQWTEGGFTAGGSVNTGLDARTLLLAAERIAAVALQNLPPCAAGPATRADEDACADELITHFGLRAFRRPLVAAERDRLRALYQELRGPEVADGFREALGDVITAMLQTPEFLYRRELAPGGALADGPLIRYDAYELASRLSYLFWRSMPDEALFAAAGGGRLTTTTQLVEQARRLLGDERARSSVEDFHVQLLEAGDVEGLSKDPVFTSYTPAVARSLLGETRAFASSVFLGAQADGKLSTLLTSPIAFVDGPLARYYGVDPPAGTGVQRVSLPPQQRAGLLTRGAFLASKADSYTDNPVQRGRLLLDRFFCAPLPEPDNLAVPPLTEPPVNATTRQRFESHGMNACAVACHQKVIDPLGFAFEHYDATGAWRTTEQGQPVDAHAKVIFPGETIEFEDAIALSKLMANRPDVQRCMSVQWLRYQLGRRELAIERPTVNALAEVLRHGDDLRELMVALVRTRTFTHRSPSPGETQP